MLFSCEACGSPAICVSAELSAAAKVQCARCGRLFGTWSHVQEMTIRVLMEEAAGAVARSVDPLPVSVERESPPTASAKR